MVIKREEYFFYACDGSALKSVKDMLDWIRSSNEDSFTYHVNADKNDFVGWVKTILKDNVLAKKIATVKTREEMIEEVEKRINSKKRKTKKGVINQIKKAIAHE